MNNFKADKIRIEILRLATIRGMEKTFCPSEVARKLFPDDWREQMVTVREVADGLIDDNKLEVLQKGNIKKLNASNLKGPIRLRLK